jgi:hypothetical protein
MQKAAQSPNKAKSRTLCGFLLSLACLGIVREEGVMAWRGIEPPTREFLIEVSPPP